jgi:HEAT repeat protein
MSPGTKRGGNGRTPAAVRSLRWILIALLFTSATLTLVGVPELARAVARGGWPRAALAVPPAILAVFIAGYAAYRFVLVRAGRYSAGKALVQVALMVLVLGVMAGVVVELAQASRAERAAVAVDLAGPLRSSDPEVRALAAELARHRPRESAVREVPRLIELLEDPSPEVRRQARDSLVALAGRDAGGEGPDAAARWREYWSVAAGGR